MQKKFFFRFLALLVLLTFILLLVPTNVTEAITRSEIAQRAQAWVNQGVTYCWPNVSCAPGDTQFTSDGWRKDCSGFVSYAWNLRNSNGSPINYVTSTLPQVAFQISKEQLQQGDVLLKASSHVLIFDHWYDSSHNSYYAWEETPPKTRYVLVPYPYWSDNAYLPYRYNGLGGDTDDNRNIAFGQTLSGAISPSYDVDTYYFSGTAGQSVTITQNKTDSLDSLVELWKDSSLVGVDDDGGGNYNSRLVRTLPSTGTYRILAKGYSSSTGGYNLSLSGTAATDPDDGRWISFGQTLSGTINPSSDTDTYYFNGTAGRVMSLRMNANGSSIDSWIELWGPNGYIGYNDDGGGDRNSLLTTTLSTTGVYRVVARSYNGLSTGTYNVVLTQEGQTTQNLARNKTAYVSSVEFSGVEGYRATDGNLGTRWSSAFSDPQWIYIDLGNNYTVNQVVLKWEAAYARRYGIYYWDGYQWQNLYWTNYGDGGTDVINFNARSLRYIEMYGLQRATPWGYSLYEFEVYNTNSIMAPLVLPDDPDKPQDTGLGQEPLPPIDDTKDVTALFVGDGAEGQENIPLPESEPAEANPTMDPLNPGGPPVAQIDAINPSTVYQGTAPIHFSGSGTPNGNDGNDIAHYVWSSSIDGAFGPESAAEFNWPSMFLSPGTHEITLKVQDVEGNWSDVTTTSLTVQACVALPIKPTLTAPANNTLVKKRNVYLDWQDTVCGFTYQVQVRKGSKSGAVVDSATNLQSSEYTTRKLAKGSTYVWRVRACNSIGCGKWSGYRTFQINP